MDAQYSPWFREWSRDLAGQFLVIPASSMEEARLQLAGNSDVAAIAMTPKIGTESIDPLELARCAGEDFDGPVIIMTKDAVAARAGNIHYCDRTQLPSAILTLFAD